MTVKTVALLILICLIAPYLLGLIWTKRLSKANEQNSITLAFIFGFFSMLILFQIPAVPMIIYKQSFKLLEYIWLIEIMLFCVFSIIYNWKRLRGILKQKIKEIECWKKENRFVQLLTISFFLLVFAQAVLLSHADIYDTDDARYIAESLDAIKTDKMLLTNPITGEGIEAPIGEMKRDVVAPFMLLEGAISDLCEIHTATLCHVILPLLLIPLCYMVYWLLSVRIFGENSLEKRMIFLNFVCIILMFGRLSAYWQSAYLLWRIWQGKAILRAIVIPIVLWVMASLVQNSKEEMYYLFLGAIVLGSCLLTTMSLVFLVIIISLYYVILCLYQKKIFSIKTIITMIPLVIYGLVTVCI